MFGVIDLPTYLAGLVLIVLLPGPNSLYVLSVAARRGVRAGYTAAAGVWCGDTVLMTLSAAGVASLLQANALLFGIVKYAGAGYLTWLAVGERNLFTTKRPVTSLEDMKDLKVRVMQSPGYIAGYKALGANPTPLAYN